MMQQFATSSSKLAVSALSMDMNHAEAYSKDTKNTFGESRNAFEKAIADAEQSAFVKASDFAKGSEVFEKQVYQQPVIREPNVTDDVSNIHHQSLDGEAPNDLADSAQGEKAEDTVMAEIAQPSIKDSADMALTSQNELADNTTKAEQDAIVDQALPSVDTEKQITDFENAANEFDYINFVTQIQTLNDDPIENSAPVTDGISENEQSLDLTNIRLTEDELQIILDAQQAGVDLQDIMTEEQLLKLSDAINKMLSQFHNQNNSDEAQTAHSELLKDVDQLDVKLLETMLTQSASERVADVKQAQFDNDVDSSKNVINTLESDATNISTAASQDLTEQSVAAPISDTPLEGRDVLAGVADEIGGALNSLSDINIQANKQALATELDPTQLNESTQSPLENAKVSAEIIASSAAKEAGIAALNVATAQPLAEPTTNENLATLNAAPTQTKPVTHENFDVAKQLAMLDERSQTNIIENIKSRVEKFAADLSGNSSKGSEFVAAMQVGLKEFKEQLQSGREPGIDLKALISDAMSQANVEIPAQAQTKIDGALNQFAGLMNLANVVNQSSKAQAHQLFGLTETQMIKESNALHTEGTKIAQQTPTNFDKAVNIFKPDGQQQLAEKVRWMVNGRNPAAEIRFDPPELGSMQIKINMTADTAAVSFTVQSANAKDALDQALPKLRDMLQEQGIELGQSSVEQQASGQSEQQNEQQNSAQATGTNQLASALHGDETNSPEVFEQRITGGSLGGIDFYA